MSASSINRKVAEIEKAKKVERRNAIIERQKPKDDIIQHIKTEVGGISAESSDSNSVIDSGEVKEKPKAPKAKSNASKKRGSGKKVFSNSKAAKI
tara:strand:+ start:1166 stop:1450 length:285 start_codon:yes stop_codon:yes gene_type:complete